MTTASDIPLTPNVARHIAEQLFQKQSLWKRAALVDEVQRIHLANGGLAGQQNPSAVVKKALSNLQEDGLIEKHHYGHWKWKSALPITMVEEDVQGMDADTEDEGADAEKILGAGTESVYLYFNPNDRKLALLESRSVWECKIGRSSMANAAIRIEAQGARTALSHEPVIGLLMRTLDSAALERALHASLRLTDAQVPDSPGTEWFMTSPRQVEEWFDRFQSCLLAFKK